MRLSSRVHRELRIRAVFNHLFDVRDVERKFTHIGSFNLIRVLLHVTKEFFKWIEGVHEHASCFE